MQQDITENTFFLFFTTIYKLNFVKNTFKFSYFYIHRSITQASMLKNVYICKLTSRLEKNPLFHIHMFNIY